MGEDLQRLKQRLPLLEYLNRHHWKGHRVGTGPEFVIAVILVFAQNNGETGL